MKKKNRNIAILGLLLMVNFMLWGNMLRNTAEAAGRQGDKVWTAAGPLWETTHDWLTLLDRTTGGTSIYPLGFPYDNNSQVVVKAVAFCATRIGDSLMFFGYDSGVTDSDTLAEAFSGGVTTGMKLSGGNSWKDLDAITSVSFFAIDDGGGNVGFGRFTGSPSGSGDILSIDTGVSTFAMGPNENQPSLSGVTFAAGSKVFLMTKIAEIRATSFNVATLLDNESGLVAATIGSPLLAVLEDSNPDNSGSGVSLFSVTAEYE